MGNFICCRNGDCSKIHFTNSKKENRKSTADDNPIQMGTLERQPRSEKEKLSEDALRERLKYEYSSPCQRCKMKDRPLHARVPIKLIIQVLKIMFVTTQLILVGLQRTAFAEYHDQSNKVLKHLLLQDIKSHPKNEELSDPIDAPDYTIYTKSDLFSHVDFAVSQFPGVPDRTMGSFYFTSQNSTPQTEMELCLSYYTSSQFFSINNTLSLNEITTSNCFMAEASQLMNNYSFNTEKILTEKNLLKDIDRDSQIFNNDCGSPEYNGDETGCSGRLSISCLAFDTRHVYRCQNRMLSIELRFSLKMVLLSKHIHIWGVDCFLNDGKILFDNSDRTGEVSVSLKTQVSLFDCHGSYPRTWRKSSRDIGIATVVILLDIVSIILCSISIRNSIILLKDTRKFFAKQKAETDGVRLRRQASVELIKQKKLHLSEQIDLLKLWDCLVVVNDVLTIAGTSVLLSMGHTNLMEMYDAGTTLLGLGGLLVWMGILRYFSFFPEFYLLFLIVKRAIKSVIRYLICVVILYGGFVFCGWLVLGPYHRKFRTLESAAECLFSTITGDELYETFVGITRTTGYIWWFSRIYLYVFVGLFTLLAFNLLIAICMESYDTIKMFCKEGFPPSALMEFIQGTDSEDTADDAPYFCTNGFVTETQTYVEERPKTVFELDRPKTIAMDMLRLKNDGAISSFHA